MPPGRASGRLAAVVGAAVLALGCGPLGVIPGGPLAGEVVAEELDDWSFTDEHILCAIETRGRIYPGVAEEVTTVAEATPVARAQVLKYTGLDAEHVAPLLGPPEPGDDRAWVRIFRITSTGAAR